MINPRKGFIKVNGTIIISAVERNLFFVLNRGLRWTKTVRKTASGNQTIKPSKSDALEVPRFYNGELWTFDVLDEVQEEFVIDFEYEGQIHPPSKDLEIPIMGYIKKDFVELACYCAWYPVPLNIETNMAFEIALEGPEDWIWKVNGNLQKSEQNENSFIWTWKQKSLVNDIIIVGLPERDAFTSDESYFWGPKDIVGGQKVLDEDIKRMKILLDDWLGPLQSESQIKFVITPRTEGGAYARSGLIIVGGGYSTEVSLRKHVLQSMCHELCHDWFCKATVMSFDNWVDEALSEYCSIMTTEKYFNDGYLEWRLVRTKEKLKEYGHIASIRSLTRDQEESYAAFYFRGFLLLNKLSEHFGKSKFEKTIGEFAQFCVYNKNITSDLFLDYMEREFGDESRVIANRWLDYDGVGIPSEAS